MILTFDMVLMVKYLRNRSKRLLINEQAIIPLSTCDLPGNVLPALAISGHHNNRHFRFQYLVYKTATQHIDEKNSSCCNVTDILK